METNILASKSPRRKHLLDQIGFKFSTVPSNFKEYSNKNFTPEALAESLARGKAMKVAKMYENKIIIGADTVVSFNDECFGKPKDRKESFKMLRTYPYVIKLQFILIFFIFCLVLNFGFFLIDKATSFSYGHEIVAI